MMTYRELLIKLQRFSEKQLNSYVCIYDPGFDEYYRQNVELVFAAENDVLDIDHPIIRI